LGTVTGTLSGDSLIVKFDPGQGCCLVHIISPGNLIAQKFGSSDAAVLDEPSGFESSTFIHNLYIRASSRLPTLPIRWSVTSSPRESCQHSDAASGGCGCSASSHQYLIPCTAERDRDFVVSAIVLFGRPAFDSSSYRTRPWSWTVPHPTAGRRTQGHFDGVCMWDGLWWTSGSESLKLRSEAPGIMSASMTLPKQIFQRIKTNSETKGLEFGVSQIERNDKISTCDSPDPLQHKTETFTWLFAITECQCFQLL
jgi:hypothetical protein